MSKTGKISWVVLGCVAVLGVGVWLTLTRAATRPGTDGPEGARGAGGGAPATLVTLALAARQDVPVTIAVNGSVMSLNSVDVRPQVSNMVQKVHVKEGQFVHAGELLFTLDDRADRANLDKANAQQLRDQAALADLERQYKRSQDLVAQSFIAQSAADTTLSQVEAQRAAVASDRAAVQSAQVALSYDVIRSPIAGRIGAINLFAGSLAQPATVMVTVTQLDPIAVSFPVPEGSLQDLLAAAKVRSRVSASVPGLREPLQGVLSFVDNTVDPTVGTVRAKAEFDNHLQQLWPGQYVNTSITVRTLKDATVVPLAALIMSPSGKIVYVVAKDDQVQPRKVQVDYSFNEQAVLRGVQPGERIVVEGKQNLKAGSRVRVEKAAALEPAKKDPA
jgi:RND family efflux transporter MFP subunit